MWYFCRVQITKMLNRPVRWWIHLVLALMGLVLIIGGIVRSESGATIVGLIVSAVNARQWLEYYRAQKKGRP